jgi:hypothetical protein
MKRTSSYAVIQSEGGRVRHCVAAHTPCLAGRWRGLTENGVADEPELGGSQHLGYLRGGSRDLQVRLAWCLGARER